MYIRKREHKIDPCEAVHPKKLKKIKLEHVIVILTHSILTLNGIKQYLTNTYLILPTILVSKMCRLVLVKDSKITNVEI